VKCIPQVQVDLFKKQASDQLDELTVKSVLVKGETSPDGIHNIDEVIHECRTHLSQTQNDADLSLTSLTQLLDDFVDYNGEYERQVRWWLELHSIFISIVC